MMLTISIISLFLYVFCFSLIREEPAPLTGFYNALGSPAADGLITIPQCAVFLALFYMSKSLMPLMTAGMIGDFKAVDGIITLALGLKLSGIRHYDAINLLPAIILVFFYLSPLESAAVLTPASRPKTPGIAGEPAKGRPHTAAA